MTSHPTKFHLTTHALVHCNLTPSSPEFAGVCKEWIVQHFPNKSESGIDDFISSFERILKRKFKEAQSKKNLLTRPKYQDFLAGEIKIKDVEPAKPPESISPPMPPEEGSPPKKPKLDVFQPTEEELFLLVKDFLKTKSSKAA